jgi:hypothetical protein
MEGPQLSPFRAHLRGRAEATTFWIVGEPPVTDQSSQMPRDARPMRPRSDDLWIVRRNGRGKIRLLSRKALDGRTAAVKQFDSIALAIVQDLGGSDNLSTIERHLVEAFAGCALHVQELTAKQLLGEEVDLTKHAQAVTTMVRVATRLPIGRRAKTIGATLSEIIRERRDDDDDPRTADGGPQTADEGALP